MEKKLKLIITNKTRPLDFLPPTVKLKSEGRRFRPPFSSSLEFRRWCFVRGIIYFLVISAASYILFHFKLIENKATVLGVATIALAYIGAWIGYYTYEMGKFSSKWQYLAQLYNSRVECLKNFNEVESRKLYEVKTICLAIDAIVSEMWRHPSYSEIVYNELIEAVMYSKKFVNYDKSRFYITKLVISGRMTEREAIAYLEEYQEYIVNLIMDEGYSRAA